MPIQGSIRKLYIQISGSFVPIGCLTSNGFSENTTTFETTVRENNGYRSIIPLTLSYTVSFDGLVENSIGDPNKISLDRLRGIMRAKQVVTWKLESDGGAILDFGYGYITELADSANVGDFVTFNGVIQGTGEVYNIENDPQASPGPQAPFIYFNTIDESFISIGWAVPESGFPIASFKIYRNDVFFDEISYSGSGLPQNYIDTGISPDSTYSYNVSAVDINASESPLSNKIIAGPSTGGNEIPDGGFDYLVQESWETGDFVKDHAFTMESNELLTKEYDV